MNDQGDHSPGEVVPPPIITPPPLPRNDGPLESDGGLWSATWFKLAIGLSSLALVTVVASIGVVEWNRRVPPERQEQQAVASTRAQDLREAPVTAPATSDDASASDKLVEPSVEPTPSVAPDVKDPGLSPEPPVRPDARGSKAAVDERFELSVLEWWMVKAIYFGRTRNFDRLLAIRDAVNRRLAFLRGADAHDSVITAYAAFTRHLDKAMTETRRLKEAELELWRKPTGTATVGEIWGNAIKDSAVNRLKGELKGERRPYTADEFYQDTIENAIAGAAVEGTRLFQKPIEIRRNHIAQVEVWRTFQTELTSAAKDAVKVLREAEGWTNTEALFSTEGTWFIRFGDANPNVPDRELKALQGHPMLLLHVVDIKLRDKSNREQLQEAGRLAQQAFELVPEGPPDDQFRAVVLKRQIAEGHRQLLESVDQKRFAVASLDKELAKDVETMCRRLIEFDPHSLPDVWQV